ncbi:hypothetical protein ACROYT_G008705 [Oculina patagonica]
MDVAMTTSPGPTLHGVFIEVTEVLVTFLIGFVEIVVLVGQGLLKKNVKNWDVVGMTVCVALCGVLGHDGMCRHERRRSRDLAASYFI